MLLLLLLGLARGGARVTLNKAATDTFGRDAPWLLLRAHGGALELKLSAARTDATTPDVVLDLRQRPRGGAEAIIEPTSAPTEGLTAVLGVLPQRQERPYALLSSIANGWLVAEPFLADGDPPRAEPHLRMWWKHSPTLPSAPTDDPYVRRVRAASLLVREASRKAGKSSNEVIAARGVMREFESLARDVLPDLILPNLDPREVRLAANTLYSLADRVERQRSLTRISSSSAAPSSDDLASVDPPSPQRRR